MVAAFAMGKAPVALPALQREFALSPVAESLILSLVQLIAATSAIVDPAMFGGAVPGVLCD